MVVQNKSMLIAICYFIFISILFLLPGSAFPKNNLLAKIHFDKWVHIGSFSLLTFLFCNALKPRTTAGSLWIFAAAMCYGIFVEFIQHQFIVNRSLDLYDWAADIGGALAGICFWKYLKNRPL